MVKTEDAFNYFKYLSRLDKFLIGHKGFIAGGCFKNIFNNEDVKDIDIFFVSEYDWADAVKYFDTYTKGYNGEDRQEEKYYFYYENNNVKAYKHIESGIIVELCRSIFGKPEHILKQFDFTITKFAYYKEEEEADPFDEDSTGSVTYKVAFEEKFFEHLHLKRLVLDDKVPFPMGTFERMIRYVKYGYMPCKETKQKLIEEIRNLTDKEVKIPENLYNGWD